MAKKFGYIVLTWFFTIFAYVILAVSMPAFTGITTEASNSMQSTSNMTNYPGTLAAVDSAPVYIWFIPGGVAIIATIAFLRQPTEAG